jgi:hypothetical protein
MIAYYEFNTNAEYVCQVVTTDVDHFPTYGHFRVQELKIVLNVMSRIVSPTNCVPVGQQAMMKFLIDSQMHIVALDATQETIRFVRDAGIHLEAGKKPQVHSCRVIACMFGEPHPDDRYQSVIYSRVIDPDAYGVIPTTTPARQERLGLRWTERTRSVSRWVEGSMKVKEFKGHSIPSKLFAYLYQHDKHCSAMELMNHVWGKGSGSLDALRHHIGFVKKLLKPLGVTVDCTRSVGYTLLELTSDGHECETSTLIDP